MVIIIIIKKSTKILHKSTVTHVSINSDTFDCGFEWKIKIGKTNQTHLGHDSAWREASNLKYDKQSTARNGPRTALQYPWFVAERCVRPTTVQIHWTLNVLYKVRKKLRFLYFRDARISFYFYNNSDGKWGSLGFVYQSGIQGKSDLFDNNILRQNHTFMIKTIK